MQPALVLLGYNIEQQIKKIYKRPLTIYWWRWTIQGHYDQLTAISNLSTVIGDLLAAINDLPMAINTISGALNDLFRAINNLLTAINDPWTAINGVLIAMRIYYYASTIY